MPGVEEVDTTPGSGEGAEGHPTVPHIYSQACRACGTQMAFSEVPEDGILRCPVCDVPHIFEEERFATEEEGD